MRPILALNCLLQIEQERSEEESSVGNPLAMAFRCARFELLYGSGKRTKKKKKPKKLFTPNPGVSRTPPKLSQLIRVNSEDDL